MGQQPRHPFDEALLRQRRRQGRFAPDFLERLAGEELLARLAELNVGMPLAGSDQRRKVRLERLLLFGPAWMAEKARLLCPRTQVVIADWLARRDGEVVVEDFTALPFEDGRFDAALVLFDLAFVNRLPEALLELRRVLGDEGWLLASLPGEDSLHELRAAWAKADEARFGEPRARVAPFCDMRQLGQLARMAGFTQVVADVERFRVRHADALALMRELKEAGWSNPLDARPRTPCTRRLLALAAAYYELEHTQADGRVSASLALVHLLAGSDGRAAMADR